MTAVNDEEDVDGLLGLDADDSLDDEERESEELELFVDADESEEDDELVGLVELLDPSEEVEELELEDDLPTVEEDELDPLDHEEEEPEEWEVELLDLARVDELLDEPVLAVLTLDGEEAEVAVDALLTLLLLLLDEDRNAVLGDDAEEAVDSDELELVRLELAELGDVGDSELVDELDW